MSKRWRILPDIFNRGVEWYKSIGSNEKNTGPELYCVSGHVNKPAVVERELGIPLMELIEVECGGVRNGHKLKGVIPGGSSVPILRPEECDVRMDFDSLASKGTHLGSCGMMVIDETAWDGGGRFAFEDRPVLRRGNLRTVYAMPRRHVVDGTSASSDSSTATAKWKT